MSNSTLYPDVLKIKTNCCETKFYKNAICLLFTNFQIHHLATLLPRCPSHRVARYGFVNKKWHFWKILFDNNHCFCFQNIWIQCRIWHILSMVKQILVFSQFKNRFLANFEIVKNGIWSKKNFSREIDFLDFTSFLALDFSIFLANYVF